MSGHDPNRPPWGAPPPGAPWPQAQAPQAPANPGGAYAPQPHPGAQSPYAQPQAPQAHYGQAPYPQAPYPQAPYPQTPYAQGPAPLAQGGGPWPQTSPQGYAPQPGPAQWPTAGSVPTAQPNGDWASFGGPANAKPVGLTGPIPCPHCGQPTINTANSGYSYGGLIGMLLTSALSDKRWCRMHGEIPHAAFPAPHRDAITMRRIAKGLGALALFGVVFLLIMLRALL